MLQVAIIVFREFLEIALIVAIVMAGTKIVKKRNIYVACGLLVGFIISIIMAIFFNRLMLFFSDDTQYLLNASILAMAAAMIGWTVSCMYNYAGELNNNVKITAGAIDQGEQPGFAIAIIVAMAVIREGTELVLFLYGAVIVHMHDLLSSVIGAIIGAVGGILIGTLIYIGAIKVLNRYIFTATRWLLIFLGASLASQIPNLLASYGVLDFGMNILWDSSGIINEQSFIGNVLHLLFGYSEKPTIMQILFYISSLLLIGHKEIKRLII